MNMTDNTSDVSGIQSQGNRCSLDSCKQQKTDQESQYNYLSNQYEELFGQNTEQEKIIKGCRRDVIHFIGSQITKLTEICSCKRRRIRLKS